LLDHPSPISCRPSEKTGSERRIFVFKVERKPRILEDPTRLLALKTQASRLSLV